MNRFWKKVDKTGECWVWTAGRNVKGYGKFRYNGEARLAHRVSFLMAHGFLAPVIMHTCDNPRCVNPDHLRAGTHEENMKDMVAKNRGRGPSISPKVMRQILNAKGSQATVAKRYGVSASTVGNARRRQAK